MKQKDRLGILLFGYDVFISFALGEKPRGTQLYAADLARKLHERGYAVFFSEEEAPPGNKLDDALSGALHKSKVLVVIINRETLDQPRWVRIEVEEFRKRHPRRPIITINIDGALQDSRLGPASNEWLDFENRIWINESGIACDRGEASPDVVERLALAPRHVATKVKWQRTIIMSATITFGLIAAAAWYFYSASLERTNKTALRLVNEAESMMSGERTDGDIRALLQLVAAYRIAPLPETEFGILKAILARKSLIKIVQTNEAIRAITFCGKDDSLFAAGRDQRVSVWNSTSGDPIGELPHASTKGFTKLACSRYGNLIAYESMEGDLRVSDANSLEQIGDTFGGYAPGGYCLAWSPDGGLYISGGKAGTIRAWDSGSDSQNTKNIRSEDSPENCDLAISADGEHIASVNKKLSNTLLIENLRTGRSVASLHLKKNDEGIDGDVNKIAYIPGTSHLVSAHDDGTVRFWNTATRKEILPPLRVGQSSALDIAVRGDGKQIAASMANGVVRLRNLFEGDESDGVEVALSGHVGAATAIAYNTAGNRIVTGGQDGTLRIWRSSLYPSLGKRVFKTADPITTIALSPNGGLIAYGTARNRVGVVATDTWEHFGNIKEGATERVNSVAFSPDGRTVAAGSNDGKVRLWATSLIGKVSPLLTMDAGESASSNVDVVAYSRDGRRIISGSSDGSIRVWDAMTGILIRNQNGSHSISVRAIAVSPDGIRVASGGGDRAIRFWNSSSGDSIPPEIVTDGRIRSIAFNLDGTKLVSGDDKGTVLLWDAKTGQRLSTQSIGHKSTVTSVAFSPDGYYVASGSNDGDVRIWRLSSSGDLVSVPMRQGGWVKGVAFSADGKTIISASFSGAISIWPSPQSWVDKLCSKLTMNMSTKQWNEWVSPTIPYTCQCNGLPIPSENVANRQPLNDGTRRCFVRDER